MRLWNAATRGLSLRKSVILAAVAAQFMGCASTPAIRHVPISETIQKPVPIDSEPPARPTPDGVASSDSGVRPAELNPRGQGETRPRPAKPSTRKAKFQRALRRGAIKTEDGAKEALKVTGRVGLVALVVGAVAGLLYLDLWLDGDIDSDDETPGE